MAIKTHFLTEDTYKYLQQVSLREHSALKKLRDETLLMSDSIMQTSPEQGQFMQLLIKLIDAKRVLEIGVFTGYSALAIALALPEDGKLIACDINEEYTNIAKEYWAETGVAGKVELFIEPASELLEKLDPNNPFDIIFLDADQANYNTYYEKCLPLLRKNGLLLIDDTLWEGKVVDSKITDPIVNSMQKLNLRLLEDERVDISMLPIGDGLTLVRKK